MNKKKEINLTGLPRNWSDCTIVELLKINKIKGQYKSKESYLTYCLMSLLGITPLCYKSRWKNILGQIPFIKRFLSKDGREISAIDNDYLQLGAPFISYRSCYCFSGLKNFLFGKRFWIEDQEIHYWLKNLEWLNNPPFFLKNPVDKKKIGRKTYYSSFTRLADMCWNDYSKCCMYVELFEKTNDKFYLYKFISTLYKIDDDVTVSKYFTAFETQLILIFWSSVQKNYMSTFPHIFSKRKKGAKEKSSDYMKNEAQITVFLAKQSGALPKEVQDMEAFYALEYMEANAIENEEHEKRMASIRR